MLRNPAHETGNIVTLKNSACLAITTQSLMHDHVVDAAHMLPLLCDILYGLVNVAMTTRHTAMEQK